MTMRRLTTRARLHNDKRVLQVEASSVSSLIPARDARRLPSSRDLLLQGLLHLPRLASPHGTVDVEAGSRELDRLNALRGDELKPYADLAAVPSSIPSLSELNVRV